MFDRSCKQRTGRLVVRGAVGAAVVVLGVGGLAGTASAEQTPPQGVDGYVEVGTSIALTGLPTDFTLTGMTGDTVTQLDAVTYNVETNNPAGYVVTVEGAAWEMVGLNANNTDTIPIQALGMRDGTDPAEPAYVPVEGPQQWNGADVHTQDAPSAEGGDELSTDFQVVIPFVNPDTYSATVNYIASTL